jgi:hypothetical protein
VVADTYSARVRLIRLGEIEPVVGSTTAAVAADGAIRGGGGCLSSASGKRPASTAPAAVATAAAVAWRQRREVAIAAARQSTVVNTLAGSDEEGCADGSLAVATFTEPISVAVDVAGRVVVSDRLRGGDLTAARTLLRVIEPASGNIRTVELAGDVADAAFSGDSDEVETHIAIDNDGTLWCSNSRGTFAVTGAGLAPGFHAYTNVWWRPTAQCHHRHCSAAARRAVWVVLLIWNRSRTGPRGLRAGSGGTGGVPHGASPARADIGDERRRGAATEAATTAGGWGVGVRLDDRSAGFFALAVLPIEIWCVAHLM